MCSPLCCLHSAIHISSLCGFWHCHPYIPIHFWKMFFILYITQVIVWKHAVAVHLHVSSSVQISIAQAKHHRRCLTIYVNNHIIVHTCMSYACFFSFCTLVPDSGCIGKALPSERLQILETGWIHSLQQEICTGGAIQQPSLPTKYTHRQSSCRKECFGGSFGA